MKIIKTNGEILECNIEEYNAIYNNNLFQERIVKSKEINKPVINKKIEYIKKPRRILVSSGLRWTKKEDNILIKNRGKSLIELQKMLSNRTTKSIYMRLTNHLKNRHTIKPDDKRIKMMTFVSHRTRELQKLNPQIEKYKLQKIAFQDYRTMKSTGVK